MAQSKSLQYWLFKTEPTTFSIDDLANAPEQTTFWDGVRNYQARNYLRDTVRVGDRVLLYHSNADPPAIVGVAQVVRSGYPDHTAQDPRDPHYDPKASAANPLWFMVDIRLESRLAKPLSLEALRANEALEGLELLRKGSRLSIQPVSTEHFQAVLQMTRPARSRRTR